MSTHNIYTFHHKAIRSILGRINQDIGSTNFENPEEVEILKEKILGLMSLLASHAYTEESIILKALQDKGVDLSELDPHSHDKLDHLLFKIVSAVQSFTRETEDLNEKGRILYLIFNQFHGEYLLHMFQEEVEILPLIISNLNEEELQKLPEQLTKKTPVKILLDWFRNSLPALTTQERVYALTPIVNGSDKETLATVLSIAKKELNETQFEDTIQELGLKKV